MVTKVINIEVRDGDLNDLNRDLNKVEKNFKDVERSADKTSAGLKDVGKNGGAIAVLDELTGGLATKTRDVAEATELFNFKLKGMRTALIATGIGAFVVALGVVVAYWDEIVDFITLANKKLEIQAETLKQSSDILDSRIKLNQANQKLLESQGKSTEKLVKEEKDLIDAKIANLSAQEKILTAQLENEKSTVKEVTLWERIKINALEAAGLYEQAAKARAEAILGDEEERQDLIDREKALLDLQTNIISLRKERLNLDKPKVDGSGKNKREKQEDLDIITPEGREKFAEGLKKIAEDRETGLEFLSRKAQEEIQLWQNTEQAKTAITADGEREREQERRKGAKLGVQIAMEELEAQTQIRQGYANLLGQFGNLLTQLAEDNKALAIAGIIAQQLAGAANVIISTVEANAKAVAFSPITGGQPWVGINTASATLGIASAALAAKQSISALGGGGGANSPSFRGGGGGVSAPSFNVVGTSGVNQLAESLQQDNEPIQAYVVANNVTSAQSLNNNIVETASIG